MNRKKIFIILSAILAATIVVIPVLAGISGTGISGIQVQNLSSVNKAYVTVQLWNQNGSAPLTISTTGGDQINENAAKNYYLPNYTGVANGSYSMIVGSNEQVAAIARTDWSSTGGAGIYSSVNPSTDIIVPLITKNFAGQTSQFSVQNTNSSASISDVTLTLYGRGSSTPIITLPPQTILAGTSKTYSMNDAMWGTLPNNGADLGVATGFVGSLRVTSATPLVVQTFIDIPGSRGVTAFSGVPSNSSGTTLFCPLIRANYYGDTGISIVNPNNASVTVNITFYGDAASPHTGTYTQNGIAIAANSSQIPFQGPGGSSRTAGLPGGSQSSSNPTPTNDGFYGVAKLVSTGGPILAVVNDTLFGSGWSVQAQSSYNCVSLTESGTKFAAPLLRRYHLASTRLTTGIQVQNTGATPITVSLDLYNWDGTHQSASNPPSLNIPAWGSGNWWNGNLTGLPTVPPSAGGSGWYGSGIITITGGTGVVVVSDEGFGTTRVDSANYNALKMP